MLLHPGPGRRLSHTTSDACCLRGKHSGRQVQTQHGGETLGADENSRLSVALSETIEECKPAGWSGKITLTESRDWSDGGWDASSQSDATITLQGGTGQWEASENGSSTATNLTQGCAKKGSTLYSGRGAAVLNVGGAGAPSDRAGTSRSAARGKDTVAVQVTVERDGSYSLRFDMTLEGTSRIVMTGRSDRCEVGENIEEDVESIGASVKGEGSPNPDRLSGTRTEPIESYDGTQIGVRMVTWDLSRR